MKYAAPILVCFSLIASAGAQTPATHAVNSADSTSPASSTTTASPATLGAYRDESLRLAFNYPRELQPQTAATFKQVMERGHREHYKTEPESDPEHQQAEKCMHVLLYATTPDPTSGEITINSKDHDPPVSVKLPPTAMIMIAEFDRSCIPHGTKENDILGQMASMSGQLPGLKPIDQQIWYEVDKHKIHFLAAQGEFSDSKDTSPVGVATASTNVRGRLLMWMFMSNNLPTLNRLMSSTVQFDDHPAATFVPFTLGNGEPIKPVP